MLQLDGPDTHAFLQGQLTNDISLVTQTHSQNTGYCTAKGRLYASMLLWRNENAYYMLLPQELCEPVRKRLSMYILRSKVKAVDVSSKFALYGLGGTQAPTLVATLAGTAPGAPHEVVHGAEGAAIKLPVDRFLLIVQATAATRVEAACTQCAPVSESGLWSALDIAAGIPNVVAATQEQFVPQTVNFDLIGAVSFGKGCYPGQEIVARAHYLGRVKQRMVRARIVAKEPPQPGDKLYSTEYGGQASGMVVNSVAVNENTHEVLAVVQSSSIDTTTVHWHAPDGPALQLLPLPYAVK